MGAKRAFRTGTGAAAELYHPPPRHRVQSKAAFEKFKLTLHSLGNLGGREWIPTKATRSAWQE